MWASSGKMCSFKHIFKLITNAFRYVTMKRSASAIERGCIVGRGEVMLIKTIETKGEWICQRCSVIWTPAVRHEAYKADGTTSNDDGTHFTERNADTSIQQVCYGGLCVAAGVRVSRAGYMIRAQCETPCYHGTAPAETPGWYESLIGCNFLKDGLCHGEGQIDDSDCCECYEFNLIRWLCSPLGKSDQWRLMEPERWREGLQLSGWLIDSATNGAQTNAVEDF